MERHTPHSLHRLAVITAVATFVLLIVGGLVTSTDSGLSVPDWPLSYGGLFPPMVGGIRFEHTHRVIAGIVALLIAVLAGCLYRHEPRRWVRRLGYGALAAVLTQAVLGGLTVLLVLPPPISIAHACLGQTVFCLVVGIVLVTSSAWRDARSVVRDAVARRLCVTLTALCMLQLVLGAVVRHSGYVLGFHLLGAPVLIVTTALLLKRLDVIGAPYSLVMKLSWGLVVGLVAQVSLGVATLLSGRHPILATAHVGLGALLLAGSWVLTLLAYRNG